ncbi:hypothetical protein CcCBS67573_g02106 [Chytriomyces confervae]|uniref:Uncharacterized protein n=1 Tax=Chytriomyces confervae TaxID=246404 RepID=A0A507FK69_9FUNG|nr:hypothetical protein CcCBS67573_g02106 [Chytriomyces confervae]
MSTSEPVRHHPHASTFTYRYGKPLSAFVLYSSLALVGLQFAWTTLDFEEQRINTRARIVALNTQLSHWRAVEEEKLRLRAAETGGAVRGDEASSGKSWWAWKS